METCHLGKFAWRGIVSIIGKTQSSAEFFRFLEESVSNSGVKKRANDQPSHSQFFDSTFSSQTRKMQKVVSGTVAGFIAAYSVWQFQRMNVSRKSSYLKRGVLSSPPPSLSDFTIGCTIVAELA